MPQDPLYPVSESGARPRSPDTAGGSERKRRRKVLSCYDCRRRKLQCDRAVPACGRCTKAGQAANCLYIEDGADAPTRHPEAANAEFSRGPLEGHYSRPIQAPPPSTTGDTLARLEYQDKRIKQLEAALLQTGQAPVAHPVQQLKQSRLPLTPESPAAVEPTTAAVNVTDRETMMLRGKSFKTQFHGITHPGSLIAYIPELSTFTKETFEKIPGLMRIRQDMKALEDRTPYNAVGSVTDADLRAALPPRIEADHLVKLYLDNYDSIYHILHLPSFHREYGDMWNNPQEARAHFIALVLLIMATAQCLQNTEPWLYTASSSVVREKAIAAIGLCERWLETQSQKHVTCIDFQIRFLLNLAKVVNALKFKRTWTDAGTMIRFFMAAGLHRSPDLLRKPTSPLDKEMRRRLWAAAAEFELQTSFWRGMISAPFPQQSDCPPPSNIHDEDLWTDNDNAPPSRHLNEFTSSSYLTFAAETFNLRYTLNTVLNNIRQTISFEDARQYTEEIEAYLSSIPDWIGSSAEAPRANLSITLRNYILVIHDRQYRQAKTQGERDFAKMTLLNAASKIVEAHQSLVAKGCRALQLLCHDQIRPALSVCHIASTPDPGADTMLTNLVDQQASKIITDVCDHLANKITHYGREQRQLWIVLAANGFMKSKKDPEKKLAYMQEAVDKITRPYFKIMAGQQDGTSVGEIIDRGRKAGRSLEMPNGIIEYMPVSNGSGSGAGEGVGGKDGWSASANANGNASGTGSGSGNVMDPTLLDFDDLAAWTFEDWSFNPVDFQSFDGIV
jgi:hypothetical protein